MALLKVYIALLLGMTIIFYLNGYTSPMLALLTGYACPTGAGGCSIGDLGDQALVTRSAGPDFGDRLLQIFSDPSFLVTLGAVALASVLLSAASGMAVTFSLPLFVIMAIMNMLALPTTTLMSDPIIPEGLKIVFNLIMNGLMMLTILEFVRGGSV